MCGVVVRRNRVRLGQLRTTSRSRWPPAWPLPSLPRPTNMHQHQLQEHANNTTAGYSRMVGLGIVN